MDEQLKQAFIQYLQQKSGAQTQEEFEAYLQQLGEEGLKQEYAQFMQLVQQQQVASRRLGGMLNYIQTLRGVCPEGYEMQYFKKGGKTCKKCMKKVTMEDGGMTPENPIDAFRCGRKMKKKKCENGSTIEMDKCGSKMKKKACGGSVKTDQKGGTVRAVKTVTTYPDQLENQRADIQYFNDGTQAVRNGGWGSDGMYRENLIGRQGEFGKTYGTPRQQQIADSLRNVDWKQFGWGPVYVPALKKISRTK